MPLQHLSRAVDFSKLCWQREPPLEFVQILVMDDENMEKSVILVQQINPSIKFSKDKNKSMCNHCCVQFSTAYVSFYLALFHLAYYFLCKGCNSHAEN